MKTTATKRTFIQLRAEGKSFSAIASQLRISKSTCCKWDRSLASEIGEARQAELASLAEEYALARAARIRSLGETLRAVDGALAKSDLSTVPPAQLLAMKLRYMEAVKAEGVDRAEAPSLTYDTLSEEALLTAYCGVLDRARSGEDVNIQAEARLLDDVRHAFNATKGERWQKDLERVRLRNRQLYDEDEDDEVDGDGDD